MLDSAAVGAIIGFLGRAGPEILKFADRHLDRLHELAMMDKTIALEGLPGSAKTSAKAMLDAGELQEVFSLMRESYKQQFDTGNPWLNAVSILVRPGATAALLALYIGVKVKMVGAAVELLPMTQHAYTENDVTLLAGILAYWFMDRQISKGK